MRFEFISFMRIHNIGGPYESATEILNTYGQEGWQLISVVARPAELENQVFEIFYLQRQAKPV